MPQTSSVPVPGIASQRKSPAAIMIITMIALLIPVAWYFGTSFMTPSRFLFMFTVPYFGIRLLKGDYGGILVVDWMMLGFILWMGVTVGIHHPSQLVSFTGSTGLNILGGYLTARAVVRSPADFHAFARLLAVCVILLLPLAAYESIGRSGAILLHFIDEKADFLLTYRDSKYCCRLGLDRAQVVFEHPIHYAMFCTLPMALYVTGLTNQASIGKRLVVGTLLFFACFMGVSSGPVLSLAFQIGLIFYTIVLRNNPSQWRLLLTTMALFYMVLELSTTKFAFFTLSEKLAFNSWNVYIRALLYDAGVAVIKDSPLFGIGYNRFPGLPWYLSGSVDNFWLQMGAAHGLPGLFLCMGSFVYAMAYAGRNTFIKGSDLYYARLAYAFALASLLLALSAVTVWGELHTLVFMVLGCGQFLFYSHEPSGQSLPEGSVEPDGRRSRKIYTRFPTGPLQPSGTLARRKNALSR